MEEQLRTSSGNISKFEIFSPRTLAHVIAKNEGIMNKRVLCTAVGLLALSTASATVAVAQAPKSTNHADVASSIIANPKFKSAAAIFDRDHEKIVSELIEITEIPSPPFKEKVRAEAYRKKLADLGLSNVEIDEEGNVLAIRKGTASDGKFVAVIAHLDTVFPEGTEVKVRREGTKLMAPGIGDDAKGLTAVLAYLRAMDEAKIQTKDDILYRPQFLRHRIEAYAARAADGSWLCRTAFGV
ncbi:M20/M25/M40 family metallo-hydrolase [Microvirga calopogonii]|uniref:M20/M25/M40 family metallo-hydrolase n=1 Tax=Microvirga calopogonii TaxID=2078013 RepID=UPI001FE09944|nr:M20/M25/M40 family metallo-hydrolase [Microvirga calopogonii]